MKAAGALWRNAVLRRAPASLVPLTSHGAGARPTRKCLLLITMCLLTYYQLVTSVPSNRWMVVWYVCHLLMCVYRVLR